MPPILTTRRLFALDAGSPKIFRPTTCTPHFLCYDVRTF
jgi:hypothetical protein